MRSALRMADPEGKISKQTHAENQTTSPPGLPAPVAPGAQGRVHHLAFGLQSMEQAGNERKLIFPPLLFSSPAVPPVFTQGPFKMLVPL